MGNTSIRMITIPSTNRPSAFYGSRPCKMQFVALNQLPLSELFVDFASLGLSRRLWILGKTIGS